MPYPSSLLTAVCEMLLDEGMTRDQIANIARDIPGECGSIADNRAEAAWIERNERLMENGGLDDSAYRRDVKAAGRGHLIKT